MNLTTNTQFDTAMTQARIELMKHDKWTFFSALILFMETVVTDEVPTLETDGVKLWINPDFFVNGLPTKGQRCTVLAHEAMHPALQHNFRFLQGVHDEDLWNQAADHVINIMLSDAGFEPIPNWYCDFRFRGMDTETVYKILRQEQSQQPQPKPQPDPQGGGGAGGSGVTGENSPQGAPGKDIKRPEAGDDGQGIADAKNHVTETLQKAAQMVAMQGKDPGCIPKDIQVYLDSLLKPKLPMAQHLRRFFQNMAKNDYSWRKLNRRFKPMILPAMWSEKLSDLAFAYDMSGSVSERDIKRYNSEMVGVTRNLKPDKIHLVQFDTEIKSVHVIKSVKDLLKVPLTGRGGTDINPLMEWAKKNKPKALIVFTDGEYRHPNFNPGCPVLWMIHGSRKEKFKCDFGTIIRFDTE